MYFDIRVNNSGTAFQIVESHSKNKRCHNALDTLNKIAFVLESKLKYINTHKDNYYHKSEYELCDFLQEKSVEIYTKYQTKQAKQNWFFGKLKELAQVAMRINQVKKPEPPRYMIPSKKPLLELPCPEGLTDFLEISDLAALAVTNRAGKMAKAKAMPKKAREFGYVGNDRAEAMKYLDDLFKEIEELIKIGIIAEKHVSFKKDARTVDVMKTLNNLQNLWMPDLIAILSHGNLYTPEFQKTRKIFNIQGNWKVPDVVSEDVLKKGIEALGWSTLFGYKNLVELLLHLGINPNSLPLTRIPPLFYAARTGNLEIAQLLISKGASAKIKNKHSNTALNYACNDLFCNEHLPYQANAKLVELLLKHEANPNVKDKYGYTPLQAAVVQGNTDIVKVLIAHGARKNILQLHDLTRSLHYAVNGVEGRQRQTSNLRIIKLLLQHGANPNTLDARGYSPVQCAAEDSHLGIVELLLKHKAHVDQGYAKHAGMTALYYACGGGTLRPFKLNAQVVQRLLEQGANPHTTDNHGTSPLHLAAKTGHADIVKLLLEYGAPVDAKDAFGNTALMYASEGDLSLTPNPKVIELLLQAKAD